jgi:hypothetical protein
MKFSQSQTAVVTATALVLLMRAPASLEAQFQTTSTTFSGQATVVSGRILGTPITLVDTGPVDAAGGQLEAHAVCYAGGSECDVNLPNLTGDALSVQLLNATVVAQGDHSRARTSVAELTLKVAGQSISANFLQAQATAQCSSGAAFIRAESDIAVLVVNGQRIAVTGDVNQRVPIVDALGTTLGTVVINEQVADASGGNGDVTVSALHISVPAADTELFIARAHADIHCGQRFCPLDKDFVTGGGWIADPRRNFAIAGGKKNGDFWGHLLYINHETRMKVKGTGVTAYVVTGSTTRHIEGTCEVNGQFCTYLADVTDGGEPGAGTDRLKLTLSNGERAEAFLSGGNLQLHTCK